MRYERDGFSVEAAKKKGRPIPDDHWFHECPDIPYGGDFFFAAYRDLISCRHPDGPIPWTAVMKWADRRRLNGSLADALWTVINLLDSAERNWRYEQLKRDQGGA